MAEWLNAQAAGGYVEYHPVSGTYELTTEGALVLADPESPVFVPPAWDVPASMFLDSQDTIEAFRTGHGVPWGDRDPGLHEGIAGFYRNAYRASIATEWIPALDGVAETLTRGRRGGRRRLRPRPLRDRDGRGVPGLALRRHRQPRRVDRRRPGARPGRPA